MKLTPPASIERIARALQVVACLAEKDHVYVPIFERLDGELQALEELAQRNDPVARVRARLKRDLLQ
ncbi:hypothetical protein [Frigidibacter oleivorans]|uniref:hypothetical protein n=1 Tax=Frigidibacter oleivorans TaxID=2487129 RepID=UPI000F8CD147|nr:hypothetical protein [Frigidibacter oleivorans]